MRGFWLSIALLFPLPNLSSQAGDTGPRITLRGHTERVWCVVFNPDGKTLASAGSDRVIKLWDAAERQEYGHTQGA